MDIEKYYLFDWDQKIKPSELDGQDMDALTLQVSTQYIQLLLSYDYTSRAETFREMAKAEVLQMMLKKLVLINPLMTKEEITPKDLIKSLISKYKVLEDGNEEKHIQNFTDNFKKIATDYATCY